MRLIIIQIITEYIFCAATALCSCFRLEAPAHTRSPLGLG